MDLDVDIRADGRRLQATLEVARFAHNGAPYVRARILRPPREDTSLSLLARRCGLTRAETDVLAELAAGRTNAEIARRLHVSTHTVRTHLMHIFPKLGVHSRAQALVRLLNGPRD